MGERGLCRDMGDPVFLTRFIVVCSPLRTANNTSLWVFWFYRHRRPVFFDDLVGKQKGRYDGTNIIWSQWPGQVRQWLGEMDPL